MWRSRGTIFLIAIAIAGCGIASDGLATLDESSKHENVATSLPLLDANQESSQAPSDASVEPVDLNESVQLLRDNLRWNRLLRDIDYKRPDLWPKCPAETSAGDELRAIEFGSFNVVCVPLEWVEGDQRFEADQPVLPVSAFSALYHDVGEAPWLWIDNPLINQDAIQEANFWIAENLDTSDYRIAELGELSFYCLDDPFRSCVAAWHPPTFRGGDDISVNAIGTDETGKAQLAALDRHLVDLINFFNGLEDQPEQAANNAP